MTERNTDADTEDDSISSIDPQPADGEVSPCYQAYVERNEHRPNVCTIYSTVTTGAPEETWIRAREPAFVSRDDAR